MYGFIDGQADFSVISYLAGVRRLDDGLHCFLHILFAHHDGNQDSFNRTGIIHHAIVRNKPVLVNELINFATQYGTVQKQLLNEFEIPYALVD